MEGFSLFRDVEAVALSIENLVDFRTDGMPYLFLESEVDLLSRYHGLAVLFYLFHLFPARDQSNCHDGSGQRTAGLPPAGYTTGQGAGSLEDLTISNRQLFLQSCKNCLRSPGIPHIVFEGLGADLLNEFLFFFIHVLTPPLKSISKSPLCPCIQLSIIGHSTES